MVRPNVVIVLSAYQIIELQDIVMSTNSNRTVLQKVVPEFVVDNILQQEGVYTVFV